MRQGLHPVQEALSKSHGSQCGFCTPGFVMSMYALLRSVQGNGDRPLFLPGEAISRSSGCQFIIQASFFAHRCPYYYPSRWMPHPPPCRSSETAPTEEEVEDALGGNLW